MAIAVDTLTTAPGWLRERSFDAGFIGGVAGIALVCGAVVTAEPRLFVPILLLDLWLLGYHHVVATYTRLCFDRESFREHRFLMAWLPPLVLGAVAAAAFSLGVWVLTTTYLYWQWFHYTRQSYGIAQVYRRKAGVSLPENDRLGLLAFYALPLWGILHRSHQGAQTFLGAELRMLPVPGSVVEVVGVVSLLAVAGWLWTRLQAWRRGELPVAHTLYVLSHHALFGVGYLVIDDLNHGWLVLNVWHNAQYILFVWMFNVRRFDRRPAPSARFLSWISQERNAPLYFTVCLGISTALYVGIETAAASAVMLIVFYQTINFHHYIVDAIVWKVRRRSLQQTLGIPA